jgi:hypothetical protein
VRSSGVITDEVLRRADQAYLTRVIRQHGWPPIQQDRPWLDAALAGGPLDGRHYYHDPATMVNGPPPEIRVYTGEMAEIPLAALMVQEREDPVGQVPLPPPPQLHVYRRGFQVCGHGLWCPVPYVWVQ